MGALVYVLFVVALIIGYVLGRWQLTWKVPGKRFNNRIEQHYIEGLNQLLNEQPDAAIDTFVSALDVNEDTLETHFALGALWRRRGEVERAIRIHQNLMARPSLKTEHLEQAQLELGLDYARSGLLDRAEALFRDLSTSSYASIKATALEHLVKIYEQEQEWNQAIETAEFLCHKKLRTDVLRWRHMQAHYGCELAEPLISAGADERAQGWLTLAKAYDRQHPRVRILNARMDLAAGDAAAALRALRQLDSREAYLIEVVPMVLEGYRMLGSESSAEEYLAGLYQQNSLVGLLPYMADRAFARHGDVEAVEFVIQELQAQPEQRHISQLLDAVGANNVSFPSIRPILEEQLGFTYHCRSCGFEGTQLYWCCPSCKTWL